jgi:hypothetical protein
MSIKSFAAPLIGGAFLLVSAVPADAGTFLEGSTLNFAAAHMSSMEGANTSHVVGPGTEFSTNAAGVWTVDVSDFSLVMTFGSATTFTVPNTWTAPFTLSAGGLTLMNGLRVSDLGNSAPAFGDVAVLTGTTLSGFDTTRVRFDSNMLLVDLAGLHSNVGDVVELRISPVPETASWALFAAGAGVLVGLRRRRIGRS